MGKHVSGRSQNKTTFTASPPYWDFSAKDSEANEAYEDRFHSWLRDRLRDRLPDQAKTNLKMFAVHKMAVAVIVYHCKYLDDHLHPNSIVTSSSIWNDKILFDDKVTIKHPWD